MAAVRHAGLANRSSQTGNVHVDFADASGHLSPGLRVTVSQAAPGMAPQSIPITLRNTGLVGARYSVSSENDASNQAALDDVLIATVTDEAGDALYGGTLSGLTFHGRAEPDQIRSYRLAIAWPQGSSNDGANRGGSISFRLRADATPAAG